MGKTMCELDKKGRKKYRNPEGKYKCKKCGERVDDKKRVCKPEKRR